MEWTQITLRTATADRDTAEAIALAVADAIYTEDLSDLLEASGSWAAHPELIDPALLEGDREHVSISLFVAPEQAPAETRLFLEERLAAAGIAYTLSQTTVEEADWADAWKAYYRPVEISPRLLICPSWLSCEPRPGQALLRLDPGMAFGTGTHETTRLCLLLLERALTPGARVLDVGCGSGVLSIAAKLLGAGDTTGVDIDPTAVRVARENAAENGLAGGLDYRVGDLSAGVTGPYHLILANIVADVVVRLLPQAAALLLPGGALVASGLLDSRADEVAALAAEHGFTAEARLSEGGWSALLLCKA